MSMKVFGFNGLILAHGRGDAEKILTVCSSGVASSLAKPGSKCDLIKVFLDSADTFNTGQ
jgi:hypothetical protein